MDIHTTSGALIRFAACIALASPAIAGAANAAISIASRERYRADIKWVTGVSLFIASYFAIKWGAQTLFPNVFSPAQVQVCTMQDTAAVTNFQFGSSLALFFGGRFVVRSIVRRLIS